MDVKDKLALLYPSLSDELLALLVDNAKSYVCDYCNLSEYDSSLDSTLVRMVQEDVTKVDSQGMSSESAGGVSVSYTSDYSPMVYKTLNRHKRMRVVGGDRHV